MSRFDPASLALLGKMDYVISLLEGQKSSPGVDNPQSVACSPEHAGPWSTVAAANPDSLEIPPKCNLSFRILKWPEFSNAHHGNTEGTLFEGHSSWNPPLSGRSQGIVEDDIPSYVQRFLAYVHTKNPVIDHGVLLQFSREVVENGLHWDGPTTLVVSIQSTN